MGIRITTVERKETVDFRSMRAEEVINLLGSNSKGLQQTEVENRLKQYGYNEIFLVGQKRNIQNVLAGTYPDKFSVAGSLSQPAHFYRLLYSFYISELTVIYELVEVFSRWVVKEFDLYFPSYL